MPFDVTRCTMALNGPRRAAKHGRQARHPNGSQAGRTPIRFANSGDTAMDTALAARRLAAKTVAQPDGCFVWTGHSNKYGYAQVAPGDGRKVYVHRLAYELAHGPIPAGLEIDHLCRNTACLNTAHLEAVTKRVNHARTAGIKHGPYDVGITCRHGHLRSENTRISVGVRYCAACKRNSTAQRRLANRRG